MEKSYSLLEEIHNCFPCEPRDIRTYSPLKLAYLGDAVYEILIRTLIIEESDGPVKNLHRQASSLVNAAAQAKVSSVLQDELTEEEQSVFRRGRNAKASSVAKHADIHDYRNATGLEALFGYLYLTDQTRRAIELLKIGFENLHIAI